MGNAGRYLTVREAGCMLKDAALLITGRLLHGIGHRFKGYEAAHPSFTAPSIFMFVLVMRCASQVVTVWS